MIQFKVDKLKEQLQSMRDFSPAVIGSLILTIDGWSIAEDLPNSFGEEPTAARSASMLALGQRIAQELGRGSLSQIFLKGDAGYIIVALINKQAALTVLCQEDSKMAMTLLDVAYSVEQLRPLL